MILTSPLTLFMRPGAQPVKNGAVVVERGFITAVGTRESILRRYPGHRVREFQNAVLLPGLVNVHTHLELPPLLDRVRAGTFPEWVMNLIRLKKGLSRRDYQNAAKQNIRTLIETGTTTVGEICTHGVSPLLLKQSSLRAVIYHEIISMGPSSLVPRLSSLLPPPSSLISHGLSPHAPYTVSEHLLRELKSFARDRNLPLAMHVAESKDEIRLLQGKKSGFEQLYRFAGWDRSRAPAAYSSVEYLMELDALGPDLLVVHAVQADGTDIKLLKKHHVPVAHCPRSNRETGVGKMRLREFLDAGITVGLGTDSLASSLSLSLWDEMRAALTIHRNSGVTAEEVLRMATTGGAHALGLASKIGTIAPGKKADLIVLPLPEKNSGDPYNDLLRETESSIMTMVNGKILHQY